MADPTATAGAEGQTHAPAELRLREATFGDWLEIGDIERQVVFVGTDDAGEPEHQVQTRRYPETVLAWLTALSGFDADELKQVPLAAFRGATLRLLQLVPPYDTAAVDDDALHGEDGSITFELHTPLPGARGQISSLTLRRPLAGDFLACGETHTIVNVGLDLETKRFKGLEHRLNPHAAGAWLSRLTAVPIPLLSLLPYREGRRIFAHLSKQLSAVTLGNSETPSTNSGSSAA